MPDLRLLSGFAVCWLTAAAFIQCFKKCLSEKFSDRQIFLQKGVYTDLMSFCEGTAALKREESGFVGH